MLETAFAATSPIRLESFRTLEAVILCPAIGAVLATGVAELVLGFVKRAASACLALIVF